MGILQHQRITRDEGSRSTYLIQKLRLKISSSTTIAALLFLFYLHSVAGDRLRSSLFLFIVTVAGDETVLKGFRPRSRFRIRTQRVLLTTLVLTPAPLVVLPLLV